MSSPLLPFPPSPPPPPPPSSPSQVTVEYDSLAGTGLELRYKYGFELGCSNATSTAWLGATASQVVGNVVVVGVPSCPGDMKPSQLRYCWRSDPCTFKMCPVYSGDLPSPPFVMSLIT